MSEPRIVSESGFARVPSTESDQVDHPAHYGGDTVYEVIKVIEAWELGFHLGNAVKYLARAGKKPGVDAEIDLQKALWYIRRQLQVSQSSCVGQDT